MYLFMYYGNAAFGLNSKCELYAFVSTEYVNCDFSLIFIINLLLIFFYISNCKIIPTYIYLSTYLPTTYALLHSSIYILTYYMDNQSDDSICV